jgi:hypothetical protein
MSDNITVTVDNTPAYQMRIAQLEDEIARLNKVISANKTEVDVLERVIERIAGRNY